VDKNLRTHNAKTGKKGASREKQVEILGFTRKNPSKSGENPMTKLESDITLAHGKHAIPPEQRARKN
jgi:hypothetical protein